MDGAGLYPLFLNPVTLAGRTWNQVKSHAGFWNYRLLSAFDGCRFPGHIGFLDCEFPTTPIISTAQTMLVAPRPETTLPVGSAIVSRPPVPFSLISKVDVFEGRPCFAVGQLRRLEYLRRTVTRPNNEDMLAFCENPMTRSLVRHLLSLSALCGLKDTEPVAAQQTSPTTEQCNGATPLLQPGALCFCAASLLPARLKKFPLDLLPLFAQPTLPLWSSIEAPLSAWLACLFYPGISSEDMDGYDTEVFSPLRTSKYDQRVAKLRELLRQRQISNPSSSTTTAEQAKQKPQAEIKFRKKTDAASRRNARSSRKKAPKSGSTTNPRKTTHETEHVELLPRSPSPPAQMPLLPALPLPSSLPPPLLPALPLPYMQVSMAPGAKQKRRSSPLVIGTILVKC